MNFDFKAAIFDLDGTLFESTDVWRKIDVIFFERRGIAFDESYVKSVGSKSLAEAADYTIQRYSLDEDPKDIIREWHELISHEYENNIMLKDGALEFLELIKSKNITMAVATGLPRVMFQAALNRLGISKYFKVCCSVEDVGKGKNSPDLFFHTADLLSCSPQECILFEDVPEVMEVAKKIGMKVCGVWDIVSAKKQGGEEISDYYIKTWRELL